MSDTMLKTGPAPFKWPSAAALVTKTLDAMPLPAARIASALAYAAKPHRLPLVPQIAKAYLTDKLTRDGSGGVPQRQNISGHPSGFTGIASRLDTPAVMDAFANGFYLFSHIGPLKWWAPSQRMVLFLDETHLSKKTRRLLRNGRFTFTFDKAFDDVVEACSELRPGRPPLTWITPAIKKLFSRLHREGHAHSLEVWDQEGELVGGIYGLAVGKVFVTESLFHRADDSSKVALSLLNCHLQNWGFVMNDMKLWSRYLIDHGFRMIPRSAFNTVMDEFARAPGKTDAWRVEESFDCGNWDPAQAAEHKGEDLAPRAKTTDTIAEIARF